MASFVFCEDDALIRKMVAVMLRGSGHDLHFAASGDEGLALIARERPAAVFTDRWMPGLDGLALCDALKTSRDFAQLPVILITAALEDGERREALRRGVAAILDKPFKPMELRSLVERYTPVPPPMTTDDQR